METVSPDPHCLEERRAAARWRTKRNPGIGYQSCCGVARESDESGDAFNAFPVLLSLLFSSLRFVKGDIPQKGIFSACLLRVRSAILFGKETLLRNLISLRAVKNIRVSPSCNCVPSVRFSVSSLFGAASIRHYPWVDKVHISNKVHEKIIEMFIVTFWSASTSL